MNERQEKLLYQLLTEEKTFHIQQLASQFQCVEKTIRNDLTTLEDLLAHTSTARIYRKPGIGVTLEVSETEKARLLDQTISKQSKSHEERVLEMAYDFLVTDEPLPLKHFAQRYYISNTIVKQDLEVISSWLKRFDLELVSKQRVGNRIEGSELKRRNALAHLSGVIDKEDRKNVVLDLFQPYEITTIRKLLIDMQRQFSIPFTDGAIENLLIHALIMIKRVRQQSVITIPPEEHLQTRLRKDYNYVQWFMERVEEIMKLSLPENERVYFTWHLMGSRRNKDVSVESLHMTGKQEKVLDMLVQELGSLTGYSFYGDRILINGLHIHLHAALNRLQYGFPTTNPLLEEIKKAYPYLFHQVMIVMQNIEAEFQVGFTEDEAAYIMLHFQAAIERQQEDEETRRVLIVCHLGVGMSNLLEAKMQHYYPEMEIVASIGKRDLSSMLTKEKVDLLISTVDLENMTVPAITVSPLLEAEDRKKLQAFFTESMKGTDKEGDLSSLAKLLNPQLLWDLEREHRYEVVEELGKVLVQNGTAKLQYIHSAVNRERASATNIGGMLAIPHGDPEFLGRSSVVMTKLKQPLVWGKEEVQLVFLIAIKKEDNQLAKEVIRELSLLAEDRKRVRKLLDTDTPNDFFNRLISK